MISYIDWVKLDRISGCDHIKDMAGKPRKQCKKCPWKIDTNPYDIPGRYCESKHRALATTIAPPGEFRPDFLRVMACHETPLDKEQPCVGWLTNQLGHGNNLALRMAVLAGRIDGNVKSSGPQHERFEDTLPLTKKDK